jgi:hypothetical protein
MKKTAGAQTFASWLSADEQRKCDDYEWALHDTEVQRKYAGKIVVVFHRKILGTGSTFRSAWAAARRRRDCPEKHEVAMPVVSHTAPEDE